MSRRGGREDRWPAREVEVGATLCCRVGGLQVWALRHEQEWTIASARSADATDDTDNVGWDFSVNTTIPDGEVAELERHVFRQTDACIRLLPTLADRPVVSSPRLPLFVSPGEEATLFVGSPLWVRIDVGEPPTLLTEIAVRRPSDTWFGAPTGDGELCYSTRTRAALDIANVPPNAAWAVTPVIIRNHAPDALKIDKLKLPVPYLSVYTAENRLWTPAVTLDRQEGSEMALFDVHEGPPKQATGAKLLTHARQVPDPGLLIRAFGGLLKT